MRALGFVFFSFGLFATVACSADSADSAESKPADPNYNQPEGARCMTQPLGVHFVARPACARHLACIPNSDDWSYGGSAEGTCTAYAQEGQACSERKPCGAPFHCADKGERIGTCIPVETVAAGDVCDRDRICAANHQCVYSGQRSSHDASFPVYRCVTEVGPGEPCDAFRSCKGSTCDAATKVCACAATNGCPGANLYCANDKCEEKVSSGGVCSYDQQCLSGHCLEGKCDSRVANGMGCTNNEKCVSLNCVDGKCAPK